MTYIELSIIVLMFLTYMVGIAIYLKLPPKSKARDENKYKPGVFKKETETLAFNNSIEDIVTAIVTEIERAKYKDFKIVLKLNLDDDSCHDGGNLCVGAEESSEEAGKISDEIFEDIYDYLVELFKTANEASERGLKINHPNITIEKSAGQIKTKNL